MDPLTVLVWTFIFLVISTSVITILALVGKLKLGGGNGEQHSYYLKKLFLTLILEVLIVAVSAFGVYLGNQNEQLAGLKNLLKKEQHTDSLPDFEDTSSVVVSTDSMVQPDSILTASVSEDTTADADDSISLQPVDSLHFMRRRRDTLSALVYASSDNPRMDQKFVAIPEGFQYVGHNVEETTKSGNSSYRVEMITEADTVRAIKITADAAQQSMFGPRNWLGAKLMVVVKRRPVFSRSNLALQ